VQHDLRSQPSIGLLLAFVIMLLWIVSLAFLLLVDITQSIAIFILPAILGRTFIQTGLFIVAHDAIHGSVVPRNRRLNDLIGRSTLTLYAVLSYQKISVNHWQHHLYPGQVGDPDFHDGTHDRIFPWYLRFMTGYLDFRQIVIQFFWFGTIFIVLDFGLHICVVNLLLFWVLPILLSTLQLFFFGTYLPHRTATSEADKAKNEHHATSSNYPLILSFLTCYHFGYHWEHHEYPFLPWYKLPSSLSIDFDRDLITHQFDRCEDLNRTDMVVMDTKNQRQTHG
jgi:beta-carotene/zeaxanthin 4-ketolase